MKHLLPLLFLVFSASAGADVSGIASVMDGDTIKIGVDRIRLHGIDAPEAIQVCSKNNRLWKCGARATGYLRQLVSRNVVNCRTEKTDRYGRVVAVCFVKGVNVNEEMVKSGLALAHGPSAYVSQELSAQRAKRGMWSGTFVAPWDWRRGKRLDPGAFTSCCKICRKGKACGDYCIKLAATCSHPPGCACDGVEAPRLSSLPQAPLATLTIDSNIGDNKVYVDGQLKGSTRLVVKLPKGRYKILIEKEGYEIFKKEIDFSVAQHLRAILWPRVGAVEFEFWKSVNNSGNLDMYLAYLQQFPQGKFAGVAELKIKALGQKTVRISGDQKVDYGNYYALVIGNNAYPDPKFSNLKSAINDARAVHDLLMRKYGFTVELLVNAKRSQILKKLEDWKNRLEEDDNFLLYYAGHGYFKGDEDEYFWLPADAQYEDESNWLTTNRVVSKLRAMDAKRVLVVADSCFAAKIMRGFEKPGPTKDPSKRSLVEKARLVLTAGGNEPVMDSGGGDHSVFAQIFLKQLRKNTSVMRGYELFNRILPHVIDNSDQTPEYAPIPKAGHGGGGFFFVARKGN